MQEERFTRPCFYAGSLIATAWGKVTLRGRAYLCAFYGHGKKIGASASTCTCKKSCLTVWAASHKSWNKRTQRNISITKLFYKKLGIIFSHVTINENIATGKSGITRHLNRWAFGSGEGGVSFLSVACASKTGGGTDGRFPNLGIRGASPDILELI